ncbi:NADH dehydrogenase [ubiquinone] 1 alpha subcomplex subunit 3-like [Stylophora pistillata]|uniref:NADH dehydrogenase [ubiquinone] 1 alpha subcomplex subunit 3-like n=1 Tax=Stylophora pistillata TaxID=50429 RepID=UPI000C052BFD|nr:NADH dehydrogenase [ubiquinone] 1 alpha subcomplex subunit 3-like [Stylophora pistillata]
MRLVFLNPRSKMAGLVRKSIDWFKIAWAREPVLFMSCVFGISGPIFALVSPWTKDTVATMKSIPHVYPYPQLEDQDLSDVDSHGDNIFKVKYLF